MIVPTFFPHCRKSNPGSPICLLDVCTVSDPLTPAHIRAEGNMSVISKTVSINISRNPNVIENVSIRAECSPEEIQIYTNLFKEFWDVFAWSYEEMVGIDPSIVQHEIKMYENAKQFVRSFGWSILGKQQVLKLK